MYINICIVSLDCARLSCIVYNVTILKYYRMLPAQYVMLYKVSVSNLNLIGTCRINLLCFWKHVGHPVRSWYSTVNFRKSFNLLWPSGIIWWQSPWSTLAQVMTCCLMAPSHYLNQYWPITNGVLWHSFEKSKPQQKLKISIPKSGVKNYTF